MRASTHSAIQIIGAALLITGMTLLAAELWDTGIALAVLFIWLGAAFIAVALVNRTEVIDTPAKPPKP